MPESKIQLFCAELTQYKWEDVMNEENANKKTEHYHKYIRQLLDKYFPEETVIVSNLDKYWMTPQLKQLLREVQRARLKSGKGGKFKQLWAKFRRIKRVEIKGFYTRFVKDLKSINPVKWYQQMKKLGG